MTDAATDHLTDPETDELAETQGQAASAEDAVSAEAASEEVPLEGLADVATEDPPTEDPPPQDAPAEAEPQNAPAPKTPAPKTPARKRAAKKPAAPAPAPAAQDDGDSPEEGRSVFDGPGDWYVIHTYAGYENKVKVNLGSRIQSMQMEEKIFDVVIPMEDVMEIKGGKRQVVQKKVFPGYLLVKMVYDNDSWYVVRNTPGVTGFVVSGTGSKPTPLSRREVEKILAVKQETKAKPTYRLEWEEGDVVRIVIGPFADFTGTIAEINVEQSKLKVMVNIFDRETPVELAFDQVAKA